MNNRLSIIRTVSVVSSLFCLCVFTMVFTSFFLCHERTNASVGIDDSPLLLFLFFDDGDDSRNVVSSRVRCRFFSYFEQH